MAVVFQIFISFSDTFISVIFIKLKCNCYKSVYAVCSKIQKIVTSKDKIMLDKMDKTKIKQAHK